MITPINTRLKRFFETRAPRSDSFSLGIKNIYVFFSRQGYLFLGLLIITFVAGVNYGNNLILGLFFYLLSIWLVSAVVTFLQISSLQLRLKEVELSPSDGLLWVHFWVSTKSKSARQIELSFYALDEVVFAKHLGKQDDTQRLSIKDRQDFLHNKKVVLSHIGQADALAKDGAQGRAQVGQEVLVKLPIITDKRGVMSLPRLNVRSIYPLGIVQAWSYGYFARQALVYPAPKAFEAEPKKARAVQGDNAVGLAMVGQDDFDRLDTYQEGENLSRVSWRHLAQGMGMLTKHFADPVGQNYTLSYEDMPSAHHEDKLANLSFALTKMSDNTAFVFVLPDGETMGVGVTFVNECLIRLAKTP